MNILHVTPTYYPATYWGGPIFSVYALNNALAQLPNVTLKVLTTDSAGPKLTDRVDVDGIDPRLYPNQEVHVTRRVAGACVSIGLLLRLPAFVHWADVVHLTATYSFPTIPTLLICRFLKTPVVWSPRGAIQDACEWPGAPRKWLKRVWEWCCNVLIQPGRVVAHVTSDREKVAVESRISRAKAVVVPNGVDFPISLPDKDWRPDGKLRLMFLGRISPKKGLENLLYALRGLDDRSITLKIYGSGPPDYEASVKQLAADLLFPEDAITFVGHVEGEAKRRAFQLADVCVVPSFSENFCMVIAEALAQGVPVIASRGTPWSDLEAKQCGLWVDNSAECLSHAIVKICSMPLAEMGTRGRAWMRREYGWDAIAVEMEQVYLQILNKNEIFVRASTI